MKKTIVQAGKDFFQGKRVLMRVDFNVPQNEDGTISDDTRIKAALPTIEFLREAKAKIVLMSHLGRPKGKSEKLSLKPIAKRLTELLAQIGSGKVIFAEDCIGEPAVQSVEQLEPGDVCLLENLRFYPEEEKNDPEFAKKLSLLGDVYVDDAFGTSHRAHASTEGITRSLRPAFAGLLLEREVKMLSQTLNNPERPFATIVGGAKISSKIGVLDHLLTRADVIIIGGAMVFSFLKARGIEVGKSLVEDDQLEYCRKLEAKAKAKGVSLVLPIDFICAKEIKADAEKVYVTANEIPADMMGLDLGPESMFEILSVIKNCKTILWNGPLGVFEVAGFEVGTFALIDELVQLTKDGVKNCSRWRRFSGCPESKRYS